jgi:hypothetical protein
MSCKYAMVLLAAFSKLRPTNISLLMPVHPCVLTEQFDFQWTDIREIRHLSILKKCVDKIQVSLKSEKITGSSH